MQNGFGFAEAFSPLTLVAVSVAVAAVSEIFPFAESTVSSTLCFTSAATSRLLSSVSSTYFSVPAKNGTKPQFLKKKKKKKKTPPEILLLFTYLSFGEFLQEKPREEQRAFRELHPLEDESPLQMLDLQRLLSLWPQANDRLQLCLASSWRSRS